MKTCGTCKWWKQYGKYHWGECTAPVPQHCNLSDEYAPTGDNIREDEMYAEDCDCYEEATE